MIVPEYWAEARRQHRSRGRQVTVRRFGWSNLSMAAAETMAAERVEAALARILSGEPLPRREPRIAYNGAAGVPIREEVVARHGEEVISRNAYGARCLNSPRTLFADIDFAAGPSPLLGLLLFGLMLAALLLFARPHLHWALLLAAVLLAAVLAGPLARGLGQGVLAWRGGALALAQRRTERFLRTHPDWNLRCYRTPAGLRLLATHRPFETTDPQVADFFRAVGADPVYVRMCLNQRCFRARLTAKPWRTGVGDHLKPRPGVWPVRPEALARRQAWVTRYEQAAAGFAACRFDGERGSGHTDPALRAVIALHDRESQAQRSELPLA